MRERMIVGLAIALGIGSGCGRNLEVSDEIRASQRDVIHGDIKQVRNAAWSGTLRCQHEGECEPSLALVSTISVLGNQLVLERCSGFLISPREILTNDHCINRMVGIPSGVKEQIPCTDKLFVHFTARSGNPGPTVGCKAIKLRSGESGIDSPDYAIIEMDAEITDRKPAPLSKRGLRANEKADILRVNMASGRNGDYGGTQSHLRCEATYETYLYPQINAPTSPLMTFGDCAIIQGNSGAPVFNEDGEVSAIIQGYLIPNEASPQTVELKTVLTEEAFGHLAVASTTACISGLVGGAQSCSAPVRAANIPLKEYLSTHQKFDSAQLPDLEKGFLWELLEAQSSDSMKFYHSRPECSDSASFDSRVLQYDLKMSPKFKPIWYSDESEARLKFNRTEPINSSVNTYQNSELGSLPIQVCTK